MKTILIPTDFNEDTLNAMELTWRHVNQGPVRIILLSLSELPDSTSESLFLSADKMPWENSRRLLDEWEIRTSLLNITVNVNEHHQYGASVPLIRSIMELYSVSSIIVPYSIQKTEKHVYLEALNSIQTMKYQVTMVPERLPYSVV